MSYWSKVKQTVTAHFEKYDCILATDRHTVFNWTLFWDLKQRTNSTRMNTRFTSQQQLQHYGV